MSAQLARILVADDEPAVRNLLEMILSADGHTVTTVEDGKAALEYLKEETPDLVILDVNMPHLSGLDVCNRMKRVKRLADVPVIILTALGDERTKLEARSVKADKFMNKPLTGKNLRHTIQELLEDAQARRGPAAAQNLPSNE
jgi:DNA-binding response OmpR family regulator